MKKIILILGIIFLLIGISINPSSGINIDKKSIKIMSEGKTLFVGGSGPNNYTTIQEAINDAVDGDTVFVYDDSSPYYENIIIDKSISLIGENRNTTVIDGNYIGNVIEIIADKIIVSGFTIKNVKYHNENDYKYNVIKCENCSNIIITNNRISIGLLEVVKETAGICLKTSSFNLINNNIFFEKNLSFNIIAVEITDNSHDNNISTNVMSYYYEGVRLEKNCYDNIIIYNNIYNSICFCIVKGANNKILSNKVNNTYCGAIFIDGDSNVISNNILIYSRELGSIYIKGSKNIISRNCIERNDCGLWLENAEENIIMMNNFIQNMDDVTTYVWGYASKFPKKNQFKWNYWSGHLNRLPKIIIGLGILIIIDQGFEFIYIQVDWYPVTKPYDITNPHSYDI